MMMGEYLAKYPVARGVESKDANIELVSTTTCTLMRFNLCWVGCRPSRLRWFVDFYHELLAAV